MAQRLVRAKALAESHAQFEWLLIPAIFGLAILVAFWPALHSGFHADDFVLLTEAQLNHFGLALFKIDPTWWFYRPFSKLVWLAMYRLWGLNSAPYHLVSLGLHWLNALLVTALVQCLNDRPPLALGAGLIFALLPFHAEAVVWLASQYDLLATCGYLAALLGLLLFWRQRSIWLYLLSLLAYQISLWSKELAFTLPLMVLAIWLYAPDRPRVRVLATGLLPYLAVLSINLLQRYLAWGTLGGYSNTSSDYLAFAWDHLAGTLVLMLGPLHRLIFPASVVQLWMFGITAVVMAGLMAGLNQRMLLLAFAWLELTLLPALNILPPGADLQNTRQLYLPGVGFSIGLVALLDAIVGRWAGARRAAFVSSVGVVGLLYTAILLVHIQPWVVAGREATHIVEEMHRLVPRFPIGSRLEVVGLPDNYRGAYVLRLGFDHHYGQRYGSLFALEQVTNLPALALRDDPADALFQVQFIFDPASTRWEILRARGVMAPQQDVMDETPHTRWDFDACAHANDWVPDLASGNCEPGRGWVLTPHDGVASLLSPRLDLPVGWMEVLVDLESGADATAQLRSRAAGSDTAEAHSVELNMLAGRHSYVVFLPPNATRKPTEQIGLVVQGLAADVHVHGVVVRPIP